MNRRAVNVPRVLQLIHAAKDAEDPAVRSAVETAVSVVAMNIRNRDALVTKEVTECITLLERYVDPGVQYDTGA